VQNKHNLSPAQIDQVSLALRHFFIAYLRAGFRPVAMPSQVVDDLWHELIVHTKAYRSFCQPAFGRFLHHSPAEVLKSEPVSNRGLQRVWYQSCLVERLDPAKPKRLPLLFAIDATLAVKGGFHYAVECGSDIANGRYSTLGATGILYCAAVLSNPQPGCTAGSCGGGCGGGCSGGCGGGCGGGD
jgi:hypothetical protein